MNGRASRGLLGCATLSVLLIACGRQEPQAPRPVPTMAATRAPAPDPKVLLGRWARSDADYLIEIKDLGADGFLEATYANPRPIHVSRAQWKVDGERLLLAIELTDRGYPGNFYTLIHDPGSDALAGVYHHLGLQQTFEVAFSRVTK